MAPPFCTSSIGSPVCNEMPSSPNEVFSHAPKYVYLFTKNIVSRAKNIAKVLGEKMWNCVSGKVQLVQRFCAIFLLPH